MQGRLKETEVVMDHVTNGKKIENLEGGEYLAYCFLFCISMNFKVAKTALKCL